MAEMRNAYKILLGNLKGRDQFGILDSINMHLKK
jgi:hypothetical protein